MKKLLTFLLTALLAISVGWAETSIVTASKITSANSSWTGSSGETWSVVVDGWTNAQNMNSGYAQVGASGKAANSITFSTSGITGTITEIVINCASYNGIGTVNATVGGNSFGTQGQSIPKWSSNTGGNVTFSGSASGAIVVTMNNGTGGRAMYIKSITVTYSTGSTSTVATPTFSPAAGTYTEAQNVSISCATSGATIHYTTNGSTPTASSSVYSTPIAVNSTTTIKAIAVKSGMTNSAVAEATYTINLPATVDNLPDANAVENNSIFTFTGNAVVAYYKSYNNHTYIWLRDLNATSGGGMFYDTGTAVTTQGTVLAPGWSATRTSYNGWIEYTNASNVAASTQYGTQTVEPFDRTGQTLTSTANMNEIIVLNNITISGSGNTQTGTSENNTSYTFYKRFNITLEDGKTYNIIGAVGDYNGTVQVYPLEVTEVSEPELTITLDPETATATVGEIITVQVITDPAGAIFEASCDNDDVIIEEVEGGFEVYSDTPGTYTVSVYAMTDDLERTVTGTYTFREQVQPSDGTIYVKVTSDDDLEAGKKYIIICEEYSSGMGPVVKVGSTYIGSVVGDLEITNNEVDIEGTDVMELTLGGSEAAGWTFNNSNDYIAWYSGNSLVTRTEENNDSKWIINNDYSISNFETTARKLQYNYNNGNPRFACYTSTQKLAVLYVQKPVVTPTGFTGTLKDVEDPANEVAVGTPVSITDELVGTWASGNLLWAKDQSQQPNDVRPACQEGQIDYLRVPMHYVVNGETEEYYWQDKAWDESNWIVLDFSKVSNREDETINSFVGKRLTGVKGIYADNVNYAIELSEAPAIGTSAGDYPGYSEQNYPKPDRIGYDWDYNTYFPANFFISNQNKADQNGSIEGFVTHDIHDTEHPQSTVDLYFMNPKIQEVARIWGAWNGSGFAVYTDESHSHYNPSIDGVVNAVWTYNVNGDQSSHLVENEAYCFHAVVCKPASGRRAAAEASTSDASSDYVIYPLDFVSAETNVTAVEETRVAKAVQSVRYYNVMGMENAQPFDGLNIIVTRYTDGTSSAVKVIR